MPTRFEVFPEDCTSCGLCHERAPENMDVIADTGIARVFSQPTNTDEEEACMEAANFCPIGALRAVTPDSSEESPHAAAAAAGPNQ